MAPVRIDRCVCSNRSFRELRSVADARDASSVEELQRFVEFGRGCGLCHPYVRRMLATREVVFGQVIDDPAIPGRQ